MSTSETSSTDRPSVLESYGVLGLILAQATTIRGWDPSNASIDAQLGWPAKVEIRVIDEAIGETLAARLGLPQTRRSTRRPKALFPGHDTTSLNHWEYWEGTYAAHWVLVCAHWSTPLGDLDLAEGEELA
jgi:hypothetical protein